MADKILIHGNAGGNAVQHRSDLLSVALAEEGYGNTVSKGIFHASSLRIGNAKILADHLFPIRKGEL